MAEDCGVCSPLKATSKRSCCSCAPVAIAAGIFFLHFPHGRECVSGLPVTILATCRRLEVLFLSVCLKKLKKKEKHILAGDIVWDSSW